MTLMGTQIEKLKMICADQRCEASALSAFPFSSVSARACLPLDCFEGRFKECRGCWMMWMTLRFFQYIHTRGRGNDDTCSHV